MTRTLYPILFVVLLVSCAPATRESEPEAAPVQEAASATLPPVPSVGVPGAPEADTLETDTPEAETQGVAEPTTPPGRATGGTDTEPPQGTLRISADNLIFTSGEEAPVTVRAGEPFYLQLAFSDPSGVRELEVELRNSPFEGALDTGPFTVDPAASDCARQLLGVPTEVACTLKVDVAPDAQNILEQGEFAYAFRPVATDALGNSVLARVWGYLIVEPQ